MPQASVRLRRRWHNDGNACRYLENRGYRLLSNWQWVRPLPPRPFQDEEESAIRYLIEEWDFGGIVDEL